MCVRPYISRGYLPLEKRDRDSVLLYSEMDLLSLNEVGIWGPADEQGGQGKGQNEKAGK